MDELTEYGQSVEHIERPFMTSEVIISSVKGEFKASIYRAKLRYQLQNS